MGKKIYRTDKAPIPVGCYSQAVESGGLIFCAGQVAFDQSKGQALTGDVRAQTELVMKNIGAVLSEAGLDFRHIVKSVIYLIDMADFSEVNEIYSRFFISDPPARSTIAVAGLPRGLKVEIEVIASRA